MQRAEDVAEAQRLVKGRAGVMAKIEKPSALPVLDDILKITDGIMVARGDLGVELPLETVPSKQKHITRAARRYGYRKAQQWQPKDAGGNDEQLERKGRRQKRRDQDR